MDEEVSGFDWDRGNREKCQKHGVTVEEIEGVFLSGPHVASDLKHSAEEDRFIAIGRTGQASVRGLHLPHEVRTPPDPTGVCPIHARKGDRKL